MKEKAKFFLILGALVLVAIFMSYIMFGELCANAAPPTDREITVAKAICEKKFPEPNVTHVLARGQCLLMVEISILERRQNDGDKRSTAELKRLRGEFAQVADAIKKLEALSKKDEKSTASDKAPAATSKTVPPAPAQPASAPPAPAPAMQMPMPMQLMAAPYVLLDRPGRYAAATWEMAEMKTSNIHLTNFGRAAERELGEGTTAVRIVVLKNGRPLAIAHPGNPISFDEFFADLDRDGKPDGVAYRGINPTIVDDVFVTYQPGDRIEIMYLVLTGQLVGVQGLPPQELWTLAVKTRCGDIGRPPGRWNYISYLAMRTR